MLNPQNMPSVQDVFYVSVDTIASKDHPRELNSTKKSQAKSRDQNVEKTRHSVRMPFLLFK